MTVKKIILLSKIAAALVVSLFVAVGQSLAQEKQVNVYNWSDYIDPAVLEDFTKETGIKVRYDVFDSNEILETKLLAGKTGYDIVVPTGFFLSRQIKAGLFLPLDKSKLPNLANMWPDISNRLSAYDPGNQYAVNHMWGTTGIGYNVKKIKERMPDAPLNSWKMVFDPEIIAKFKDCGIMMLDAFEDTGTALLNYLGKNPDSKEPEDIKAAAEYFKKIRPFVRKFHSSEYSNALANGDICLVLGWSGDVGQAATRAAERNAKITDPEKKIEIGYSIPVEGAQMWFDNFAIPKDAKNVDEAHAFINYMMRTDVAAKNTNFIKYPNGNLASQKLINPVVLNDPNIYPAKEVLDKLFVITPYDQKAQRAVTEAWRNMKRK